jgi:hypothetical protein
MVGSLTADPISFIAGLLSLLLATFALMILVVCLAWCLSAALACFAVVIWWTVEGAVKMMKGWMTRG